MPNGKPATALAELQRLLRTWITAPEGVQHALDAAGDPEGRALAAAVRGDDSLPAVRRLDVYANAYFYRIHDSLAEDFGALQAGLGPELFNDLVALYLIVHPSRRPSLRDIGEGLPGFLRDGPAAAPIRERAAWAGDLARLEWALVDAFDAPDAAVVGRDEITALAPDAWESLRFAFQPALQYLELDWAVQPLREAWDRDGECADVPPVHVGESVVVWRADERVFHRRVDDLEAFALARALDGKSFGELCLGIAGETGEAAAPGRAAAFLAQWQADQLLAELHPD